MMLPSLTDLDVILCFNSLLFSLPVAQYRALHDYTPQNEDDLKLRRGEWVTLVETPGGGGWWRGRTEEGGEGWFPRTYVEYVDLEAEKKKQQDGK